MSEASEERIPAAVRTHCPYCALQCGTELRAAPGGGPPAVAPSDFPVNRGGLCQKGWTAPEVLSVRDRLRTPLVRGADGALAPAGWDEALDLVAGRLRELRAASGPDAVAVFGGGGLTNEKAYLLGKFARLALGTSRIDYNGRFCMSSAAAASNAAFGIDRGLPFPVTDLGAADVVLLAGANPAETMPPLMRHLDRPALIVADPRRTPTAARAKLHLRTAPGTDLALALGLLHTAVLEGLVDEAYVAERTRGFEEARRLALAWPPERTERVTGVPASALREAVGLLAGAERAYVLTGRGAEQHSKGTDTVAAFVNLALALGLPGREGSGYGCLTGQGNGQGGRELGQKSDQLPGYRSITDPAARARVAEVWGVPESRLPGPGPSAYELLDSLGRPGGPRALLVAGSNPVVSAPRAGHVTERLATLDLLVVADFVPSETARMADVVLPVTQWAEEEGTLTNLEGRVLRRRALLSPPPGVRTDLEVLQGLAVRLGEPRAHYPTDPREVFDEIRRATAGARADYSGITYPRLDAGEALYWPCPETGAEAGRAGTTAAEATSTGAHPARDPRPSADLDAPGPQGRSATAEPEPREADPACPAAPEPDATARRPDDTRPEADTTGYPPRAAAVAAAAGGPTATAVPHPGTPRMFLDRFAHPDGLARFGAVEFRDAAEPVSPEFPLVGTTGRVLAHYQSGAQTRRVPALQGAEPEAFVEVHPDTARRFGVVEGELARVSSVRGSVVARVRLADGLRTDTVFLPFHFAGRGRANLLTNPALDPTSRMPEFKVSAVRIEPEPGSAG
ncbi:molybdopterin-dependent oxidoreductase [Streptomyces sp. HUAS MG47]|uniref:molybdopterin oxidoreductase family protein n=1 Tax=Streptomyces solicamelliae TaxID=3231716 RepID=UPI003878432D